MPNTQACKVEGCDHEVYLHHPYCKAHTIEIIEPYVELAVRTIIAEQMGIELAALEYSTRVVEDLRVDSLDVVELAMEMEDEFGVRIPDDVAASLSTIGQMVVYIRDCLVDIDRPLASVGYDEIVARIIAARSKPEAIARSHDKAFRNKIMEEYCSAFGFTEDTLRTALGAALANQWVWQFTTIPVTKKGASSLAVLERAHLIFLCATGLVHAIVAERTITLMRYQAEDLRLEVKYSCDADGSIEMITVSHLRPSDRKPIESFSFIEEDITEATQRFLRKYFTMIDRAQKSSESA